MQRALNTTGRVVLVEPWLTPFLRFVHRICEVPVACRLSNKVDALATLIRYEQHTYEQWPS